MNGSAPMLAPFRAADGSAATPGIGFNSKPGAGFIPTASGVAVVVDGAIVAEFTALGFGMPAGAMVDFGGSTAPVGWLFCAGQAISRTSFAALFAAIGTAYGAGDTTTTFNVPDFRGRAAVSPDNLGGTDANRLPSGFTGRNTVGGSGGEGGHVLLKAELPAVGLGGSVTVVHPPHGYVQTLISGGGLAPGGFPVNIPSGYSNASTTPPANTAPTFTTDNLGSAQAMSLVQPSLVAPKIIKY